MKKIALIGTHGVGKTTTAYGIGYRLKQMRYDANVVEEGARKCPLPLNKKSTINTQKWILGEQLKKESTIRQKDIDIISVAQKKMPDFRQRRRS